MKTWWIWMAVIFMGCNGCAEKRDLPVPLDQLQRELLDNNKKKHQKETLRIHDFILKKKWPMTETTTGLNYWIYKRGNGLQPKEGQEAVLSYTIELLDGTHCYATDSLNPVKFRIGQDNVETGLHEAMQLLHVGDKAKIILPSHLAFGFTGDSEKVPQDATLIYDVYIQGVE